MSSKSGRTLDEYDQPETLANMSKEDLVEVIRSLQTRLDTTQQWQAFVRMNSKEAAYMADDNAALNTERNKQ